MLSGFFSAERPVAAHGPWRLLASAITHAPQADARDDHTGISKLRILHAHIMIFLCYRGASDTLPTCLLSGLGRAARSTSTWRDLGIPGQHTTRTLSP